LFIVRDTLFAEAENRWLDVVYSMSYERRPYLDAPCLFRRVGMRLRRA
jgi:hypothetical protein